MVLVAFAVGAACSESQSGGTAGGDGGGPDATMEAGAPPVITDVQVTPNAACTLVATVTFVTDRPTVARAHVVNSQQRDNVFDTPVESTPSTTHTIALLGMRAQSLMQITLSATDAAGLVGEARTTFTTGALPAQIPPFLIKRNDTTLTSPGYLVLSLAAYTGSPAAPEGASVVALDGALQVVWYYLGFAFDPEQLPGGGFLAIFGEQGGWEQVSMLGESQSWSGPSIGAQALDHAITPEGAGKALSTSLLLESVGGYPAPDGGTQSYPVVGAVLFEFDVDGGDARQFASTFDLFDAHYVPDPNVFNQNTWTNFYPDAGPTKDWIHQNAVAVDPTDGRIVASARNLSWIYKVERDGGLVWRLGPNGDFTLPNPGDSFAYESHGAWVTPSGNVMCFDNSFDSPLEQGQTPSSRAVEFALDTARMQATVAWQYADGFYSPIYGSAYLLPGPPDGQPTVLIDDGSDMVDPLGQYPDPTNLKFVRIIEVTHSVPARPVMEVDVDVPLGGWPSDPSFSGFASYRAFKWASLYGPSGSPSQGGGSGSSSGSSGGGSGSSSGGGTSCPPASSVPVSQVLPYVSVQQQVGACSADQISGYAATCGAGAASACTSWQQTPANHACALCIQPVNDAGLAVNAGVTLVDAQGNPWTNLPGCMAIRDKGSACAAPYEQRVQCEYAACAACRAAMQWTDLPGCFAAADQGACSTYYSASVAACAADLADGGAYDTCGDSYQGDLATVINVICGTGM